ncbi:hypothetical protein AMTRI_Chr01g111810 [Amborella trichopoda]
MAWDMDPAFAQVQEDRPSNTANLSAEGVPIIDLGPLFSSNSDDSTALSKIVDQIGKGCKEWGFFQVINHGMPIELRNEVKKVAAKFFSQSVEEKRKIRRDEDNAMGYFDAENTRNVRDWKEVFDFLVVNPSEIPAEYDGEQVTRTITMGNRWPENLPEMRKACEEYAKATEKLAIKLLELISLSLGLSATCLNGFFKNQTSFIRLNYYPPCPCPDVALGVGRHKDAGALTVLAQDEVGGLEVRGKDGKWVAVKAVLDSYIINVGDIVQVWSNDAYESAEHRVVVNSKRERFSVPFFYNPSHYEFIKPLEELLSKDNPPKYSGYNWGYLFTSRKLSNFKKMTVENLQVHHFKAFP